MGSLRSHAVNVGPIPMLLDGYRLADEDSGDGVTGAYSVSRTIVRSYAGNKITLAGGVIQALHDQGGLAIAGMDFTQGTAGSRPDDVAVNGVLTARFDGTDDVLATTAIADNLILHADGYFCLSGVLRAITTNDATVYLNDPIVGDANQYFGLHAKDIGASIVVLAFNWQGSAQADAGTTIAEGSIIDVPATFEWMHTGGVVKSRVSKAGVLGSWTAGASSGNTQNLGFAVQLANGTQMDIAEVAFANAIPPSTQQDQLAKAMLGYLEGSTGSPWVTTLPSYGHPWNATQPLDTGFTFGTLEGCEIQRDDDGSGRSFIISADNPDYGNAARLELLADDIWAGFNRSEIETQVYVQNSEDVWVSGSLMIDSTTGDDGALILQFHASSDPPEGVDGTSAVLAVRYSWDTPGWLRINTEHSVTNPAYGGQQNHIYYHAPMSKGEAHSFVLRWRPDPTGANAVLQFWLDGEIIVDAETESGFTAANQGYYLKFGIYNGAGGVASPFRLWYSGIEAGPDSLYDRIANPLRCPFA